MTAPALSPFKTLRVEAAGGPEQSKKQDIFPTTNKHSRSALVLALAETTPPVPAQWLHSKGVSQNVVLHKANTFGTPQQIKRTNQGYASHFVGFAPSLWVNPLLQPLALHNPFNWPATFLLKLNDESSCAGNDSVYYHQSHHVHPIHLLAWLNGIQSSN